MPKTIPNVDLIVVVADGNMKQALEGIFSRPLAIPARQFSFDIRVMFGNDPSCRQRGISLLSGQSTQYSHAILMFDFEGCGAVGENHSSLNTQLSAELRSTEYGENSAVIIINPELEEWVWSSSPHVDSILGWKDRIPVLRQWLATKGFVFNENGKPSRPKEAMEAALREVRVPRSSAIYGQLSKKVSFRKCIDPSFNQLISTLNEWFPPN